MKIIRLTEQELIRLVKKITEDIDDIKDIEDKDWKEEDFDDLQEPIDNPNEFDDLEDDEYIETHFDDIDKEIRIKNFMRQNKPSSSSIGSGRWDASSNKSYNPIKPTDLPLDKFLSSKYNKRK